MMGFKAVWSAARLITGIELMHMIKKGQLRCPGPTNLVMSATNHFYGLAAC